MLAKQSRITSVMISTSGQLISLLPLFFWFKFSFCFCPSYMDQKNFSLSVHVDLGERYTYSLYLLRASIHIFLLSITIFLLLCFVLHDLCVYVIIIFTL